jgi:hypothetical protein
MNYAEETKKEIFQGGLSLEWGCKHLTAKVAKNGREGRAGERNVDSQTV